MLIKEIKNIPISSFLGGGSWSLSNLQKITILMGKNGSGKSTLLEVLATTLRTTSSGDEKLLCDNGENEKVVKFEKIVPERGGFYEQDGNVTTSINNDQNFIFEASKGNSQINPTNLANELIASNLIGYMSKIPFLNLIQGHTYFEPIPWNGNLSELNKFIKALASMNTKSKVNTPIEWKAIAKVFLVNHDFPDSDKLKGASNSKIGISQELQPFYGMCRKALNENLPT